MKITIDSYKLKSHYDFTSENNWLCMCVTCDKPHLLVLVPDLDPGNKAKNSKFIMAITLHYHGISQPCRSVQLLLEAEKIPYTLHIVHIFKGTVKWGYMRHFGGYFLNNSKNIYSMVTSFI